MTREEAIERIKDIVDCYEVCLTGCELVDAGLGADDFEAFRMAINALEQEPSTDAVSRKAVLDAIEDDNRNGMWSCFASDDDAHKFKTVIKDLPPVTPTRPKGKWIMNRQFERRTCDNCNKEYRWSFYPHNYCPNCGADMRGGES